MIVLGFDTATRSTSVALLLEGGEILRARDDPGPNEHPGHATRLLAMAGELLAEAGTGWLGVERVAVGLGPGTFTGLRVGVATARGLAQSLSCELVGVSSPLALATAAADTAERETGGRVLSVIDARRGEVFVAAYGADGAEALAELVEPRALPPGLLGGVIATAEERGLGAGAWMAVGDGAIRHRRELEALPLSIPSDSSGLHLLDAGTICLLGLDERPQGGHDQLLPDYRRRPDAELALGAAAGDGRVSP
ncbi:MAG TPA: tRNA (adenosine(37)-N6)-threonylcarbamoyltransferase complex dimerization subunit type 1 TsaB [Solirubrobacteraceae bacterium]|jgi:tRNA threonylcarbamoyladenosine biosynthesis protein TsaB|nr:tRNA (adenosine(37)-N6)-threonylcarbamoyltransferase complex dimerization subunit type 1 TsaB [Solirubrobacteraceae bacterium]